MKIRTLTETQARSCWQRLLALQLRGYTDLIKRRGKVIARLEPIRPTIISRAASKED